MARSLRVIATGASHPRVAFEELRADWLPVLRQALEQGGGDGVDAWLAEVLEGQPAAASLFSELGGALRRMRVCRDLAMLEEEGLKVIELVHRALIATSPRPLSIARLEKDLEGRLDVEQLLGIVAASDDDLARRISEIGSTMAKLKDQLSSRPGSQPGDMYSSFARLKAELLLLHGELGRRGLR